MTERHGAILNEPCRRVHGQVFVVDTKPRPPVLQPNLDHVRASEINELATIDRPLVCALDGSPELQSDPAHAALWKETVQPDEADESQRAAEEINRFQDGFARRVGGEVRRGFHVKSHGAARGRLTVLEEIPDFARHGLFREPRSFDALIRFSNGFPAERWDILPDLRGCAVRVLDVPGERLLSDPREIGDQDLIALNVPWIPFERPRDFLVISTATSRNLITAPFEIRRQMGTPGAFRVTRWGLRLLRPISSVASEVYWSNLPICLGPHAIKFKWVPRATEGWGGVPFRADHLRRELGRRLRRRELRYDFMAQFFVDEERTPIERGGWEWDEDVAPYVRLAELVVPICDLESSSGQALTHALDGDAFSPWNGIEAHRPLGSVQRSRLAVYDASAQHRSARG